MVSALSCGLRWQMRYTVQLLLTCLWMGVTAEAPASPLPSAVAEDWRGPRAQAWDGGLVAALTDPPHRLQLMD